MIKIQVPYGNGYQEVELPDDMNVEIVDPPKKRSNYFCR